MTLVFIGLWRLGFRIASIFSWRFGYKSLSSKQTDLYLLRFRYLLIKWKVRRYFRKDENDRHIQHFIRHCPQGDWLVLYQMSRNMNKRSLTSSEMVMSLCTTLQLSRFFADFISLLSRTINPHDEDDCNEMEHFNKEKVIEKKEEAPSDNNQQKRRMSHVDIMFIDKEEGEDDKEDDNNQNGDKISPGALVDIMA